MPENKIIQPPLLPENELRTFVTAYFNRRHIYQTAVQHHGSPLWILESAVLKENARQFKETFNRLFTRTAFYFAMKSNNHPAISETLLEAGFGLDVSSGIELKAALDLKADDIVFSGPGKTSEELTLAIHNRDRTVILIDSFGELKQLKSLLTRSDNAQPVKVGVRLTTNPNGLWRKFGILPEMLPAFWDQVKENPNIHFQGLQFHSSWNLTPDRQVEFIILLGNILKNMPGSFNRQIEFIDIGGGYWPGEGEWLQHAGTPEGIIRTAMGHPPENVQPHYRVPGIPLDRFARILYETIHTHIFPWVDCRICFEPGRWICHSTMHILFTVIDKKESDLVITDAGTNAIGWERFETDYFPVLNLTQNSLEEKSCHILGSLCTPHDVWGYTYFGEDIREKDLLMIPCQGAYTYSLRQNFIKPLPGFLKI